jgi:hypothetical protein
MPGGAPNYRTVVLQDESLRSLQGFTQVPNVVLKHPAISFGAKVAFGVLLSYAWSDDFCFPAQDRLARDLNCSVRQVQRLLTELKDHSFINWKQQGLNRPNIYYLLPISRWHKPGTAAKPDTTNLSSPDTTDKASPEATHRSRQEATDSSHKEYSKKNTQKVVNRSDNDHRNPLDRRSIGPESLTISDRAVRSRYKLSDDQIGRVHWLVQKQIDILGAAIRNHRHYVKRAAEAVRDGNDNLLDRLLGELKQAATEIGVGTPPAYFHAMYSEALDKHSSSTRTSSVPRTIEATILPQTVLPDARAKMIADAEALGIIVPDYIRRAEVSAVAQWWAALIDVNATA